MTKPLILNDDNALRVYFKHLGKKETELEEMLRKIKLARFQAFIEIQRRKKLNQKGQ